MLPIDFSEIPSPLCWHFSYILSSQLLSQFFKCAFFKLLFSNFFMAVQWNLDLLSFLGVFLDVSFGSLSCWRAHDLQQRCSFVTLFCCTPKKRRKISRFSSLTFRFKAEPKAAKWTWNINQLPLRSPDGSVIFKRDVHVNYQRILACSLCFGNFQSGFSLSSGALLGFLPFLAATSSKNFAAPQAFNFNIARGGHREHQGLWRWTCSLEIVCACLWSSVWHLQAILCFFPL